MQENKMGVMPVKKLIVTMSVPMMLSMLVQALYNVVDSIFVARLGPEGVTALSLAFPLQMMIISVSGGTGVGINALLSKSLGEKKFDAANRAACNGIFLAFCSFLVFLLMGIFVTKPFIGSQLTGLAEGGTQDVALIQRYSEEYLGIVLILSLGLFFQVTNERLLQSTGRTVYSMISQATGAIINIIFDPIMIFGLFGFPRMEVAGAAYATVLGQFIAAILGTIFNIKYNKDITITMNGITHPDGDTIRRIYKVGIPSILMMSIGSVMTFFMNKILLVFSATADTIFGIYFKLQSFFFMPVFGLNNGVIPILAYNYGARKKARIKEALQFAIVLAFAITVTGLVVFEVAPQMLLGFFNPTEEMLLIGVPALRIIAIYFPFAGISIMLSSVFQAFSESQYSLFNSIARQLVILLPAAWLLARLGNVNYVWWAFPIAEILSMFITIVFFKKVYGKIVTPMPDNA